MPQSSPVLLRFFIMLAVQVQNVTARSKRGGAHVYEGVLHVFCDEKQVKQV